MALNVPGNPTSQPCIARLHQVGDKLSSSETIACGQPNITGQSATTLTCLQTGQHNGVTTLKPKMTPSTKRPTAPTFTMRPVAILIWRLVMAIRWLMSQPKTVTERYKSPQPKIL